jgi:pimeloyl-ACP methyl ester carboxylesterase
MIDLTVFKTAIVTTGDGATIGYRYIGSGPGIILVHGALQSALSFTRLAKALSADFPVYLPDRRGRGLSGAYGENDDRVTEANDILALANATGTTQIFGLSSGAIITLQAVLLNPVIKKIALYEPPISLVKDQFKKLEITYKQAMSEGNLGRAMAVMLKGTGDTSLFIRLPTFILAPMFNYLMKKQTGNKKEDEVPLQELVAAFYHDLIVIQGAEQLIDEAKNLTAEVLLLQGSQSKAFLKRPLDQLAGMIRIAKRVEVKNQGHIAADNSGDPLKVAAELNKFFSKL